MTRSDALTDTYERQARWVSKGQNTQLWHSATLKQCHSALAVVLF